METILYLIRHGQTDSNSAGVLQGWRDIPLSETGQEQARLLGKRFAGIHLDALYCSALGRARQTAEQIGQNTGLMPQPLAGLNEIHMGQMEGLTAEQCRQTYPRESEAMEKQVAEFAAPGGESALQVYQRVVNTLLELAGRHPGQTVAAVSHGFSIWMFLDYVKNLGSRPTELEPFWVGNTAVSKLTFSDGVFTLVYLNDQSHLPPELQS